MARQTLEDQDTALMRLGLWPFPGMHIQDVPKERRKAIYDAREALANMLPVVRLPGITAKKYRTRDIEQLIERCGV